MDCLSLGALVHRLDSGLIPFRKATECRIRVSGSEFAAGLIYGLLSVAASSEAVRLGWAHGALLTTFPVDTTMATVEQVHASTRGGFARIQRWKHSYFMRSEVPQHGVHHLFCPQGMSS